ncbi:MAG TPA: CADD family putative folate metabolism protein [Candidatus Acidoferrales bacterium]|nr:CADD family putative folate metabolism protein [Candidatus Acidoferrales bacterium]
MEVSVFWQKAGEELARFDLLKHPFYQAWSAGELTREDLKFYADQYYHQVSAFPAYLTSLHSRLPEGAMRRGVLANAYEEECDGVAHSDLWLRFAEGMGGANSNGSGQAAIAEVRDLVNAFRALASEAPVAAAFGALFAYESQVPKISAEKRNGLKQHYGADDRTCSYFTVHEEADVHHAGVWRGIISSLVERDGRNAEEALEGISRAARALWTALDGIERDRPNHKSN